MKKAKILFWVTTTLIFLTQGVMEVITGHSDMAVQGVTHLGYPLYFLTILVVFKVIGSLVLIVPQIPARIKEWAYAGFAIDFICAFISIWVVDGLSGMTFIPLVALLILIVSYVNYHKINFLKNQIA